MKIKKKQWIHKLPLPGISKNIIQPTKKNVKKTAGSSITQPHHVHANHEDDRRGW